MFGRRRLLIGLLVALPLAYASVASAQVVQTSVGAPFSLFANRDFSAWLQQGNANWQIVDGQALMDQGAGWLVGRLPLADFDLDMEYWLDSQAQASLYIRCVDSAFISDQTAYMFNLGTGTIQDYGPGSNVPLLRATKLKTAERWNTVRMTARGPYLSIWLNGQHVADKVYDTRFARGPFALHVADGAFRIRKLNVTIPGRW